MKINTKSYKCLRSLPRSMPVGPLGRVIKDGTIGDCPVCGSTTIHKHEWILFSWGDKIGCLQPECENYFDSKQKKRNKKLKSLGI